jgi:cation diffusion facilitator CzcD-associated flavoprotein CzcO
VCERFDLNKDIQFNTRVQTARFNDGTGLWEINTRNGEIVTARYCVMATGCLSSANKPNIKGIDNFQGATYHTGEWPHEGVDFSGKRVAVIGTGSSAIQAIPIIAEQAADLTVFQRTATFSIPAQNGPLDPVKTTEMKANYADYRKFCNNQLLAYDIAANDKLGSAVNDEEFMAEMERRWQVGGLYFYGAFADLLIDQKTNDRVAEFVCGKIAEIVQDPKTAKALSPKIVFGCKRICADTGYYQTFNRDNVALVDISDTGGIDEITASGFNANGKQYEFDAIVFATGFDAMTGSLNKIDIRGRDDQALKEKWSAGPRTYLGLTSVGFPNLFMISGPGSPSVLTCMVTSIEQHVEFIAETIEYLRKNGIAHIEAIESAEDNWVDHVNEVAGATLFNNCSSWYLGANVPGKTRVFMPYLGFPAYVEKCKEVVANDYEGFRLN